MGVDEERHVQTECVQSLDRSDLARDERTGHVARGPIGEPVGPAERNEIDRDLGRTAQCPGDRRLADETDIAERRPRDRDERERRERHDHPSDARHGKSGREGFFAGRWRPVGSSGSILYRAPTENGLSDHEQDNTRKSPSIGDRLKELAERLGEFLDDLTQPMPEPTPVPVRPGPRPQAPRRRRR